MLAAAVALPLLGACGGGSDDDGDGAVRLVNATADAYASLDLYASDTLLAGGVATDAASDYVALDADTHTLKLKLEGSATTLASSERSVLADTSHTLVAYVTGQALKTAFLTDAEDEPESGTAKLRVFNTSTEAGTLDVYVTDADAALADSTPTVAALAAERVSSYSEISAGSVRVRVTGSGDKTDLRLDLASVSLADGRITTLVLTTTPGGVLVHGLWVDQEAAVTAARNDKARLRLVAGAAANGTVAASANGTTLSSGMLSPGIGGYVLVDAGSLDLTLTLDGSAIPIADTNLVAGSDHTLLVGSSGGSGVATLLADDNRPALSSTAAKLRLVHGIGDLAGAITLTADYSAVATDVATLQASDAASLVAGSAMRLEASSPTAGTLYLADEATLAAGKVYTLFMLGDASSPTGVLRRDR